MKHELSGDLKGAEIAGRVLFASAFTAVTMLFIFFAIRWFSGVYS